MAKNQNPIIKKSEMVAIQNAITGELETAKVTVFVEKNKPKYKDNFTILFQAVNLALIREIKPITAKMLLYFCSICDYGNIISKNIEDISKDLGYSRQFVSIALKELQELNIIEIEKHNNEQRCNIYRINAFQSWKGKPVERMKTISQNKNQLSLPFFNTPTSPLLTPNPTFEK